MDGTAIEAKGIVLPTELDGSRLRVGIVHTRWNAQVVDALVQGAESQLVRNAPPYRHPAATNLSAALGMLVLTLVLSSAAGALQPFTAEPRICCLFPAPASQATHGVSEVIKKDVPGSYELPFAAKWMVETYKVDAVIAIGYVCGVRGPRGGTGGSDAPRSLAAAAWSPQKLPQP
jgi:6,7-dimethyl-8-ribityllumazine synthase